MRVSQNLHYLVAYSLWADHFYLIGIRPQRIPCLRIDLKIQSRSKSDCPKHAKTIFTKTQSRLPNRPDQFFFQILPTVHIVDHSIRDRIVEHPVNGEVASSSVLFRRRKGYRIRTADIQISADGAKSSNLKFPLIFKYANDPELGADRNGASKNSLDLFRTRIGCNIDIFWRETEESIPDASTGKIGNMPVAA